MSIGNVETKICSDYVKEILEYDEVRQEYTIPQDMDFSKLPPGILDAFLDWVNRFTEDERRLMFKMIADGELQINCWED